MRRRRGRLALALVLAAAVLPAAALQALAAGWAGFFLVALVASSLLAQRSLAAHVAAVAAALETGGLGAGRAAVSRIVGRDPEALDEGGVARAAVESLAENFSDGVSPRPSRSPSPACPAGRPTRRSTPPTA